MTDSLFDALGGYETLQRVHKIFYDKVYTHPWLGAFFKGHDQSFIERWLRIDRAFHKQVVKADMDAFKAEHTFKTRVVVPNPEKHS